MRTSRFQLAPASGSTSQVADRATRTGPRIIVALAALALALSAVFAMSMPASANTPSDWSRSFGTGSSYGWTNNHAWAIVTYADAISYGSGAVASALCGVVGGEEGPLNPVSRTCGSVVRQIAEALTSGHPRLTNHGLWIAYYLWPAYTTDGTW
jgi:hypothetical protein